MDTRPHASWFERHPRKAKIGILSVSIVVSLAIIEALLSVAERRAVQADTPEAQSPAVRRHIRLRERQPLTRRELFPSEEKLRKSEGLERKTYVVRTDEDGFIVPSKIHDDPDISIVFIGGSTTASIFVDEDKRFPYLAGRLLERNTAKAVNAYNAGVSGNHTVHSINTLINKIIPLEPDAAVLMHNINDFAILYHEGSYWNDHPSRGLIQSMRMEADSEPSWLRLLIALKDMTVPRLYGRLRRVIDVRGILGYRRPAPQTDEWANTRYRKLDARQFKAMFAKGLHTFIAASRIWCIRPILMTQFNRITTSGEVSPVIATWHEMLAKRGLAYEEWAEFYHQMNDVIRSVADETGVFLIDLDKAVPKSSKYLFDHVHLNNTGSELVAAHVAQRLAQLYGGDAGATEVCARPSRDGQ